MVSSFSAKVTAPGSAAPALRWTSQTPEEDAAPGSVAPARRWTGERPEEDVAAMMCAQRSKLETARLEHEQLNKA